MAGLSILVWVCSVGIFIVGMVRVIQKKALQGLALMAASVFIWIGSVLLLLGAPGYNAVHQKVAEAQARAGDRPVTAADIASASRDIEVVKNEWRTEVGGSISKWRVTLRNTSKAITYADIQYRTAYYGPSGTEVSRGRGTLYDVLKPGETKEFAEINDGFINTQATKAGFGIVDAATRP